MFGNWSRFFFHFENNKEIEIKKKKIIGERQNRWTKYTLYSTFFKKKSYVLTGGMLN